MSQPLPKRLVAEAIGTAMLLAAVVAQESWANVWPPVTLRLLANSLATGGALVAIILTFGHISGAHLNPVVTLADALHAPRLIPLSESGQLMAAVHSRANRGCCRSHRALWLVEPAIKKESR